MRIVGNFHAYIPAHGAGAEWMAHSILRDLARRGHDVYVVDSSGVGHGDIDGVQVRSKGIGPWEETIWRGADLAVTHLDQTRWAVGQARAHSVPLVHLVHNDRQLYTHGVHPEECALAVMNSVWVDDIMDWPGPSIVVHPPVVADDYRTTPGDRVTLVNLLESKGVAVLRQLAEVEPGRRFLAVTGGYGAQEPDGFTGNVEVLPNTGAMRDKVYARTRVLLMPSIYESFGRVAIEAACSGIPTIAHPTPGLVESLGEAGIFADRDDLGAWRDALKRLDNPEFYAERSALCTARAAEWEETSAKELDALEQALIDIVYPTPGPAADRLLEPTTTRKDT